MSVCGTGLVVVRTPVCILETKGDVTWIGPCRSICRRSAAFIFVRFFVHINPHWGIAPLLFPAIAQVCHCCGNDNFTDDLDDADGYALDNVRVLECSAVPDMLGMGEPVRRGDGWMEGWMEGGSEPCS